MINQAVPAVVLKTRVRDEAVEGPNPFRWQDVDTGTLFGAGRHVIFGLPGAFTPTCSNEQCPGFERLHDDFKQADVAAIHCVSVNDAFVMFNWARHLGIEKVQMLPDGSGAFTRRMGMLINKDHLGFGMRSWRYTAIVDDGVVVQMFVEPGINDIGADSDPYGESTPEKALEWVQANPYRGKAAKAA